MITMKDWMELVDYRITEGNNYGWQCYGSNAYTLDSWNGVHGLGGYSFSIIFNTKTQKVYEVSVYDYTNNRAYRMIVENKREKHRKESEMRNINSNQAWDDVDYVDLEVDEDFLEKATAIISGQDYDTSVQINIEFSDEELLTYMKIAHEKDITFNQLVTMSLQAAMDKYVKPTVTNA
jgi:hypothetical protein